MDLNCWAIIASNGDETRQDQMQRAEGSAHAGEAE